MRKKNKNNNENAQMQDMNTVQMDGANAAFAANVNFSGAILQDAEAMETLTEESGKKSKKAKKALAKKEKAKKKKEEYIEKKGLLGNADDYHVYHMKPVDTLTGYLMGVAAVAAGAYIFFYSIPFSIIAGAIAGFFSIKLYRKSLLKKRQRRLLLQFKDLLESINNSYAAGKNTPDAFLGAYNDLQMQYGETSDIVKEVAIINAGIQNNYNIEELLLDLGDRSGLEDITNFSDVFEVSNRLGGNLKQVVSESYDMIRDKIDIELEINTIVASGRNDLNIMAALPFLVVLMMKAKLYRYFYPDPIAGNSDIESINSSLTSLIDNLSIISGGGVTCDINAKNYFINQTVSVTIKREGAIPEVFSYIGMDGVSSDITVTATAASCDGAEFVRNTDMVYDFVTFLSDRLHISDKISYLKEKVQGVFQEDAKEAANAAG